MLNTNNYAQQILDLYNQGKTGKEIQLILGFKNHQPVYNFLKKYGLPNNPHVAKRIYILNEDYFNIIDSEDKAYILGFICADGHVSDNSLEFDISQQDRELLEIIKEKLNSTGQIKDYLSNNPYQRSNRKLLGKSKIKFNSIKLVNTLRNMGLQSNKTYSLNSSILRYIPKNLIRHFLRGYFDGDGNVIYGKKYSSGIKYNINICGNQEFLLNTFQKYFPSPNKLYYDPKSTQCYIWKLSSKSNVENFLEFLYKDCTIYLKRKYDIYLNMCSCKTGLIAGNS